MAIFSNRIFSPITLGATSEAVDAALEKMRRARAAQEESKDPLGQDAPRSFIKDGVVVLVTTQPKGRVSTVKMKSQRRRTGDK